MPADILTFRTRDNYMREQVEAGPDTPALTDAELYTVLHEMSLDKLDALIHLYKSTGRWNPITEKLMRRVFVELEAVYAALTGVKHGSSQSQSQSPTLIIPVGPFNLNGGGNNAG